MFSIRPVGCSLYEGSILDPKAKDCVRLVASKYPELIGFNSEILNNPKLSNNPEVLKELSLMPKEIREALLGLIKLFSIEVLLKFLQKFVQALEFANWVKIRKEYLCYIFFYLL